MLKKRAALKEDYLGAFSQFSLLLAIVHPLVQSKFQLKCKVPLRGTEGELVALLVTHNMRIAKQ